MSHSDPAYGRKLSRAGLSAYEIAKKNGFVGDEAAWLLSLVGPPGADGADGVDGAPGAPGADGADGLSAYQVAVANGFVGTEADWLLSLVGPAGADGVDGTNGTNGTDGADGADGASAYEVAVANGFVGDEATWLLSLVGPAGADGADGVDGAPGTPGADGLPGADGAPGPAGADGASAYEVAVANGFVGTEAAWLASLVGPAGAPGADGTDGVDGADAPLIPVQIMAAPDKTAPADADTFGYLDSTASNALVKFTWANIKTALQTFFERLFRTKLSAPRTYYIRTDGSDSNNGLTNTAGGAFLTLQKAVDVATALDNNGYDVTIQVGNGTYTAGVVLKPYIGSGKFNLIGNTATPSSCVISVSSGHAIYGEDAGKWKLGGFRLAAAAGTGIYARGVIQIGVIHPLEMNTSSRHFFAFLGAEISIESNWNIIGSAPLHMQASYGGKIFAVSRTCTLTGTPNFSSAFAYSQDLGLLQILAVTFSGAGTGPRYTVTGNAVLQTGVAGATYLPGNAAGSVATGGQYI